MKQLFRFLFPLVVIPTTIVILIGVAIFTFFPQDYLRGLAAERIGKSIGRQVAIGPLHLRWNGVAVDTLRVSEIPTFKTAGALFEAKGVRMGWNLGTLWQGLDVRRRTLTGSSGSFFIQEFRNPHYVANDFSVKWSLRDMDATGARLNGWAKVDQGSGAIKNIDQLIRKSPSAKVALAPVLAILNLQRSGLLNIGLPDLRHWPLDGVEGDYRFENGVMTIREFTIRSPQLGMDTKGTVNLANRKLGLKVRLEAPAKSSTGAMNAQLQVTGTMDQPRVDVTELKKQAFKATVKGLLTDPGKLKKETDALKNLFR